MGNFSKILLVLYFLFVFCFTFQQIPASDLWWYLKDGEYIVATTTVPKTDFYSFTARGKELLNHEWLAEVIFYIIYALAGLKGLYLFKGLFIAFTYTLVIYYVFKKSFNIFLGLLIGLWIVFSSYPYYFFDVRPQIFTYFLATILLMILDNKEARMKLIYLIPFMMWLWTNLHGGFILGYVLLTVYTVSFFLKREKKLAYKLLGMCLISLLLGIVNPYGWKLYTFPFRFWGNDPFRLNLVEWKPTSLSLGEEALVWALGWIAVIFFFLIYWKQIKLEHYLLFFFLTYLGINAIRHLPVVSILIPLILAPYLKCLVIGWEKAGTLLSILVIMLIITFKLPTVSFDNLTYENTWFPKDAVKFLKLNPLPGRMYNPYEWGGYLIWYYYPQKLVYIDGRGNTLYDKNLYMKSFSSAIGDLDVLKEYNINFALTNKYFEDRCKLFSLLKRSPHWYLLYEDEIAGIFIKNIPENQNIIEKSKEGRLKIPLTPEYLTFQADILARKGEFNEAQKFLNLVLCKQPDYPKALLIKSYIYVKTGQEKKAFEILLNLKKRRVKLSGLNYNLGLLWEKQGKINLAKRCYREELKINSNYYLARERLKILEK